MKQRLRESNFWIVPVLYFVWYCCTYFWDSSGGFTNKELERYTILLFVPLALAVLPRFSAQQVRLALLSFSATTIIICLLCLVKAYQEYQVSHDYRVFFYQYLGEQMHLNAIFLSNYCLASITWILYYVYIEKNGRQLFHHILALTAALFLLLMIFLLSSKLIIFLTLMLLIIFILALGYLRGFLVKALLVMGIFIALAVVAVNNIHYLKWRITTTAFKKYSGPQDDNNGIAIRLFMWETTLDLIEKRPFTGYGLKGARQELLAEYARKNFALGVSGYYHSHNQYLESTLMAGLPATILLLIMIFGALKRGVANKDLLLLLMVSHFMIQSLFEATFEVQHEFVFYIFFIFLFYYHGPGSMNNAKQQGNDRKFMF